MDHGGGRRQQRGNGGLEQCRQIRAETERSQGRPQEKERIQRQGPQLYTEIL